MVAGKFSDGQYESLPSAQSYQTLVSVYKLALSLVSSKTEIWARLRQLGNAVKLFNVLLSSQKARCLKITEKSLIQHCERSELRLHFEWTKVHKKCQKLSILEIF